MKTLVQFVIAASLVALVGLPAGAQDSRYKPLPSQAQTGDMPELLKSLRNLTDQAERSKAADPTFINDLRNLANTYDNPWPVKLLSDDFRDGDFTRNPAWTVIAGTWQVDTRGRFSGLHSTISKPKPASQQSGPTGTGTSEIIGGVLGGLLKQQQGGQSGQGDRQPSQAVADEHATIFAPVSITNAFAIRMAIASREDGGRFDFGPSVGQRGDNLYRLTYMPDAESGLVLSRVSNQGTQLLASSNGRVRLEDDKSHVIEWKRDRAGKMTVTLDGAPVIEAIDTQIARSFDGLLVDNGGGAYWIHSVEISGAK